MYGKKVVEIVEKILKERKIPKGEFYKATDISSTTFSQWRKDIYDPSKEALQRIEQYLNVSFAYNTDNGEKKITDSEIRFAMFHGNDVDDQTYEELKEYANYLLERDKKRKG